MANITPHLALVIICAGVLSLIAVIPRPHNVSEHLRKFAALPEKTDEKETSENVQPEQTEERPAWGNLDFSIFSHGDKSE